LLKGEDNTQEDERGNDLVGQFPNFSQEKSSVHERNVLEFR